MTSTLLDISTVTEKITLEPETEKITLEEYEWILRITTNLQTSFLTEMNESCDS